MSKMSDALIITGEINDMEEFWQDDLNTDIEEVNRFMAWALKQHTEFAMKEIGVDEPTLRELLRQEISFQVDCMIASENDEYDRDYKSVALALYRYYLIVYKDTFRDELTFEELEVLDEINKIRLG
jgi:hypothetical protein